MTSNEENLENKIEDNPENKNEKENTSPNKEPKMETELIPEENEKYLDLNLITRKWRVKFYKLNNKGQWDDNGIGYVFCASKENELGEKNYKLVMLNEITEQEMFNIDLNNNSVNFNHQRSTIMTWKTEDVEDDDLAISFQEKEGLKEIYNTINSCQGKNIKIENLLDEVNGSINFLEVSVPNLPNLAKIITPEMSEMRFNDFVRDLKNSNYDLIVKLGEILNSEEKKIENLKTSASSNVNAENTEEKNDNKNDKNNNIVIDDKKEINDNNENNDYDQQLIYKNLPMKNIHYIFNIFKNLILIGDKSLIEILMDDELYLITFGALEYDFETMKSIPHRKYFKNIVKFKNPLHIKNEEIIKKINQNLRLTYLRDTALSRLIEDNAVKTINTILQYNHNDIIQFFLNNTIYIEMLLDHLKNEDLDVKKEACLFISEIIECSKDVLQTRSTFSEFLFDQGILQIICQIMEDNISNDNEKINPDIKDKKEFIKITAVEIFIDVLISIPTVILDYLKKENDTKLFKQLTNIMLYSDNFGIKYEICQIYKTLIETQLKEKSSDRMLLFSEPFEILLKYLNTPISSFPNQLLQEDDKVINLHTIKLLKCLINYTDAFICNKIFSEELCNNLIILYSNNMKKNNIIISSMMDFFDSLSQNKEMIFNNVMIYLKDFFYNNKKQFELILLRYEHQQIPKKVLINYVRNDYKDVDLFMNDFDYKFMGDIFEDEDKTIDFLSKKRERFENSDDLIDNKIYENYSKKYGSNNEYSNKMNVNNKHNEEENDEEKNDDLFNFGINNINQNNDDECDDEEDNIYHILKK